MSHDATRAVDRGPRRRPSAPRLAECAAVRALVAAVLTTSTLALAPPPTAASCVSAPPALSAWWQLDTVAFGATTPEKLTGTQAALAGQPMTGVVGYVDKSFYFDGINDHVAAPDCGNIDLRSDDFTLLAWVRTPQTSSGVILSKIEFVNVAGQQRPSGFLFAVNQGQPYFQVYLPTTQTPYFYDGAFLPWVADNQWHLVAVSVDRDSPTGLRFSVDGVASPLAEDPTAWQTASIDTSADLYMARIDPALNSGSRLTGNLDEIQIYRRALSIAEIQSIWNAGPDGVCESGLSYGPSCSVAGTN